MKNVLVGIVLLSAQSVFAQSYSYNCTVTSIGDLSISGQYSSDYEISVKGGTFTRYSSDSTEVRVEPYGFLTEFEIGNRRFDFQSSIIKDTESEFKAYITDTQKKNELLLKVYKKSKKGLLLGKNIDDKKYQTLATLDCNDYSKEIDIIKSSHIDKLKQITYKQIPTSVKETMNEVDVSFEMGDGYYDVINEKIFVVKYGTRIIGYIIESELSYTEDDENAFSTDYYLANGIRFHSSMWE